MTGAGLSVVDATLFSCRLQDVFTAEMSPSGAEVMSVILLVICLMSCLAAGNSQRCVHARCRGAICLHVSCICLSSSPPKMSYKSSKEQLNGGQSNVLSGSVKSWIRPLQTV